MSWTDAIEGLSGEEIVGTFYEKELEQKSQTKLRIEIEIKKKLIKFMLRGKLW